MLYRKIAATIETHLLSDSEKITLVDGARQIGKTYIIRHVGQKCFDNFIEINMIEDYGIKKAYVLSNEQKITTNGKITYIPIYYVMFFKNNTGSGTIF